jgi:MFS family permease
VALNQHLALYITEDLQYSLAFAATAQTILTVAQLVGIALSGVLGDMWDKRWIAVGCMGFHTIGLLLIAHTRIPFLLFAGATLHGVAWGLRGPLMNGIRADYFGRRSFGAILGMSSLLVTVGTIAGPIFAGFLADKTGSYELGFTILAIVSGIGSVFFMVARRPSPPVAPHPPTPPAEVVAGG